MAGEVRTFYTQQPLVHTVFVVRSSNCFFHTDMSKLLLLGVPAKHGSLLSVSSVLFNPTNASFASCSREPFTRLFLQNRGKLPCVSFSGMASIWSPCHTVLITNPTAALLLCQSAPLISCLLADQGSCCRICT